MATIIKLADVLGILSGLGPLLFLASVVWLAKNRLLRDLSFPAALLAAKALLLLMGSLATLTLYTSPAYAQIISIWDGIGWIDTLLSLVLLAILVTKRLWQRFSVVTALIAVNVLLVSVGYAISYAAKHGLFAAHKAYAIYFYSYWGGSLVETVLWLMIGVLAIRWALRTRPNRNASQTA